ncbi:hypothetical protein BDV95DRAFT_594808 [Massariosphaeria phaeospora]|uniref:Lysine-specific metallo-endopeptidase domain-containing protein n=1 Tax=Massariosphaeria phaeospora TaxID=100035 RepID=A0A7C8I645_9PLEO|nr:hypothetical protein BDV95DRAFT_594808 [Massariosphaeria phaeospora]
MRLSSSTALGVAASVLCLEQAELLGRDYHVHPSCSLKTGWDEDWALAMEGFEEARKWVDNPDDDFEDVGFRTFRIWPDKEPEKWKKIKEPFDNILAWTVAEKKEDQFETLKASEIRVMCDNGAGGFRFLVWPTQADHYERSVIPNTGSSGPLADKFNGDGRFRKRLPQTSMRKREESPFGRAEGGIWTDIKNYQPANAPPCLVTKEEEAAAKEQGGNALPPVGRVLPLPPCSGNNITRCIEEKSAPILNSASTLSLCDRLFEKGQDGNTLYYTAGDLALTSRDWSGYDIQELASARAFTMIHEMMHVARPVHEKLDANGKLVPDTTRLPGIIDTRGAKSYLFTEFADMKYEEAIINAQNYGT